MSGRPYSIFGRQVEGANNDISGPAGTTFRRKVVDGVAKATEEDAGPGKIVLVLTDMPAPAL